MGGNGRAIGALTLILTVLNRCHKDNRVHESVTFGADSSILRMQQSVCARSNLGIFCLIFINRQASPQVQSIPKATKKIVGIR